MDNNDVLSNFNEQLSQTPELSAAVAAIKTLVKLMEDSKAETLSELRENIKKATEVMLGEDHSYAAVSAGCEQFLLYVSLANLDMNFKSVMLERAKVFLKNILKARNKTVQMAQRFIDDGAVILTHCRSRVVMQALKAAAAENKRFTVFVTESNPNQSGYHAQEELEKAGIPTTVILDAAVGYIMEQVHLVMLGAEGVVESGGIINKIGSYPICITAKSMNKPVYVVAESFKFVREFPLNQKDVRNEFKYPASIRSGKDLSKQHPLVDYTPPEYIDLMFTDLGVLTPSAVSDELIKLYC